LGWLTIATALLLFVAIGLAFTVIALGAFVILAPIAVIAAAISYRFPSRWLRPRRRQGAPRPIIIDGDFRILDAGESDPRHDGNPQMTVLTKK
jgi:Flp pilus assembly protein TadB